MERLLYLKNCIFKLKYEKLLIKKSYKKNEEQIQKAQ